MLVGERFPSYVSCTVEEFALISRSLSLSLDKLFYRRAHSLSRYTVPERKNSRNGSAVSVLDSVRALRIPETPANLSLFLSLFLFLLFSRMRERKRVVEYNNAMIPFLCDSGGYIRILCAISLPTSWTRLFFRTTRVHGLRLYPR